jgi:hypothetical protein
VVDGYVRFGATYCHHHPEDGNSKLHKFIRIYWATRRNIPEDSILEVMFSFYERKYGT